MSRYKGIIDGTRWPKYQLAKDLKCSIELDLSTDELWSLHTKLSTEFKNYVLSVDRGDERIKRDDDSAPSFLELKVELANRMLRSCHFCERNCGVDRSQGELGWCRLGSESRVSSAFLHTGEEAPLVPSGTIFFASCCFGCVFCQNDDISTNPYAGRVVSPSELARIADSLAQDGALNINYVGGDPIPNTHTILASLVHQTADVTQLWNSNLYCSEDTMRLLMDVFDVWLPDFKYGNDECALRLSGVPQYFEVISRNHLLAYQSGEVIIRHLVMPNHLECCTYPILDWVAKNMPNCLVNIMGQYRPEHKVRRSPQKYPDIARFVRREEVQAARNYATDLGICWSPVS
ncbi:MAG: radical SAM protein [Candidatus Thorarchaeota archaeon]